MALPKKQLREKLQEWGVAEEHMETAVKYILDGNSASLDALREQMDTYKTEAEKVSGLEKQLEELKKTSGDAAKVQEAFDAYRNEQETKATAAAKRAALVALAKEEGVARESFRNMIADAYDMASIELDEKGAVKNVDTHRTAIKTKYADCIGTQQQVGTPPVTPPSGGGSMTRKQIMEIKDPQQRQKAIADNIEVFTRKEE